MARSSRLAAGAAVVFAAWAAFRLFNVEPGASPSISNGTNIMANTTKTDGTSDPWRDKLTPEQYHVAREKGTERAFTGKYWNNHRDGVYKCVCCGEPLFDSTTKYESGTGWPSFYQPIAQEKIGVEADDSLFMARTEVVCRNCNAHLGHVFEDGPQPTGLRYCLNSASLDFEARAGGPGAGGTRDGN